MMGGTRCPRHYREQEMLLVFLLCKINVFSKKQELLPVWAGHAFQNNRKSCECLLGLSVLWDDDLETKSNVNYGVVARFESAKSRRMLASSLYLPQYHTSSKNKAIKSP
jgi:hypothetical protein